MTFDNSNDSQKSISLAATAETGTEVVANNSLDGLSLSTLCVHAGAAPDGLTGAVIAPLYKSTTFSQSEPGKPIADWDYSRAGNPTRDRLEVALAALERAKYCITFASGLAAENAVVSLLKAGDRVLVCDDVYGGTGRLFRTLHQDKIFDFLDLTDDNAIKAFFADETIAQSVKMIWVETPTNPLLKEINIAPLLQWSKQYGVMIVVDNTFATPIYQQPLLQGADIVLHSTTKYMGGHSDILGGAVMLNCEKLHESLRYQQFAAGAVPSPSDCELLHRSLKTLDVRMQRHQENARQIFQFLQNHDYVAQVNYPGYSGMISFALKGPYDGVKYFLEKLCLFILAESLGGVESLINHPARMTHASVPSEQRKTLGIDDNLLRLSVGIESAADLQQDLQQALDACRSKFMNEI